MPLIDAHNHLQDEDLHPHYPQIFADLKALGVQHAVVNGTREADWEAVAELAAAHPWVVPSFGLHPWYLRERTPDWEGRLEAMLNRHAGQCGIGEVGLDNWMREPDAVDQKTVLTAHLRIAAERNLPVTIHCLQAWGALLEQLSLNPLPRCGILIHAYGGPVEMVNSFVRLGAYFSFSGYFLHERKAARRAVFAQIPLERLLVETDAPAMPLPQERDRFPLPPSQKGGPINHPATILSVYEGLAEIRGVNVEELQGKIAANYQDLFGGVLRPTHKPKGNITL